MIANRKATFSPLVAAMLVLGAAAPARAELITFDTDAFGNPLTAPSNFASTTALRDLYAPLGVHFEGPGLLDGPAILNQAGNFGVPALSTPNFLAINRGSTLMGGGRPLDPFTILFDTPTYFVSLFAASGFGTNTFRMDAFDEFGSLVDSQMLTTEPATWGELRVAGNAGIARVVVAGVGNDNAFVFDDLSYNAVPEPTSFALLTVGAAGLLGYRWRRRRHEA